MVLVVLAFVSGLAFRFYGYETLFKTPPRGEFERYGMPRVRTLVGSMQMLGGAAVILGIGFAPLGALGATGLAVMMALALLVRLRIHDAPRLMVPAASRIVERCAGRDVRRWLTVGQSRSRFSIADSAASEKRNGQKWPFPSVGGISPASMWWRLEETTVTKG